MNYDQFLELVTTRRSIRRFKTDSIPDDYVMKILDAAHYSMSGGNCQPWEFLVVRDPEIKKGVYQAYLQHWEMMFYLEQQRDLKYRHPAYSASLEEKEKSRPIVGGWSDAPVYIVVLEDGRKQFAAALGARGDYASHPPHTLATSIAHACMAIHLAATSLGLASQRVDIGVHEDFRQVLKYPEPLRLNAIIPIGYGAYEPGPPRRLPLEGMVHFDQYDMSKYMRNEDFLDYLDKVRALGRPGYRASVANSGS